MNELTGQFPADWELLRLPEVLFFQEGPGITSDKFTKEGIPFINIRCFVNGRIDRSSCQFISQKLGNGEYKHFQLDVNDWVFSSSGTIGKIALIFDEDLPLLLNTSTIRFRTQDEKRLANNYIKFFLESFHFKIQHQLQTQGSAQVNVGPTHLQKMHIPLPPIKEQTQIATILSTIDRAIEQTEALISKQQRIKTGLMQDLLTKGIDENGNIRSEETHDFKDSRLGRIPMDWDVLPANLLCLEVIDCKNRTPPAREDGHAVIRTPNVRNGQFIYDELLFTDSKSYEIWTARGKPRPRDVVITREAPFGEACLIPDDLNSSCLGQRMMMYQVDPLKITNDFLVYAIYSEKVQKRLLELAGGSTVGHIRVGDIRTLLIPHPKNVDEQIKICQTLNTISQTIEKFTYEYQKLILAKTGLMQDLLTGKVRVTDLLNQKTATN